MYEITWRKLCEWNSPRDGNPRWFLRASHDIFRPTVRSFLCRARASSSPSNAILLLKLQQGKKKKIDLVVNSSNRQTIRANTVQFWQRSFTCKDTKKMSVKISATLLFVLQIFCTHTRTQYSHWEMSVVPNLSAGRTVLYTLPPSPLPLIKEQCLYSFTSVFCKNEK